MAGRLALNCFLLQPSRDPFNCLSGRSLESADFHQWIDGSTLRLDPTDRTILQALIEGDVILALLTRPSRPPAWQRAIEELFGVSDFSTGVGRSVGAIAFVGVADPVDQSLRWIAWTFGSGSRALQRSSIDPRFGVVTALNRLTAQGEGRSPLRQLEYRTHGPYSQRTGHRAARDTPLRGFRMDPLIDMVSGVGGVSSGPNPAQVFGGRPLRTHGSVDQVGDLVGFAGEAITEYRSGAYRAHFSFIDDYIPVEEETTLSTLRELVGQAVAEAQSTVDVFLPTTCSITRTIGSSDSSSCPASGRPEPRGSP